MYAKQAFFHKQIKKISNVVCTYIIQRLVTYCAYQIVRVITLENEIRPVKLHDINEQKMTFVVAKVEYNFNDNKAFLPRALEKCQLLHMKRKTWKKGLLLTYMYVPTFSI